MFCRAVLTITIIMDVDSGFRNQHRIREGEGKPEGQCWSAAVRPGPDCPIHRMCTTELVYTISNGTAPVSLPSLASSRVDVSQQLLCCD